LRPGRETVVSFSQAIRIIEKNWNSAYTLGHSTHETRCRRDVFASDDILC